MPRNDLQKRLQGCHFYIFTVAKSSFGSIFAACLVSYVTVVQQGICIPIYVDSEVNMNESLPLQCEMHPKKPWFSIGVVYLGGPGTLRDI